MATSLAASWLRIKPISGSWGIVCSFAGLYSLGLSGEGVNWALNGGCSKVSLAGPHPMSPASTTRGQYHTLSLDAVNSLKEWNRTCVWTGRGEGDRM